ncbi:hypothetical protein QWY16_18505 [Planococcus shenhongbingii]|uniref:hypothetical protein n=1 Tax=Planococcus shenhongbingii TaxID=3058398 RepID=UPI002636B943|nr:hypothetical protein [Planococcus sp. N016]WKA58461.1 hypothetical protein QWY16_18505 [Planococcus sp. N016]
MANNQSNSGSKSFDKAVPNKGRFQLIIHEKEKREGWNVKAAKHPVLTAAAIAGLGSLIWNAASKFKRE